MCFELSRILGISQLGDMAYENLVWWHTENQSLKIVVHQKERETDLGEIKNSRMVTFSELN